MKDNFNGNENGFKPDVSGGNDGIGVPPIQKDEERKKKGGLLGRLFGKKSSALPGKTAVDGASAAGRAAGAESAAVGAGARTAATAAGRTLAGAEVAGARGLFAGRGILSAIFGTRAGILGALAVIAALAIGAAVLGNLFSGNKDALTPGLFESSYGGNAADRVSGSGADASYFDTNQTPSKVASDVKAETDAPVEVADDEDAPSDIKESGDADKTRPQFTPVNSGFGGGGSGGGSYGSGSSSSQNQGDDGGDTPSVAGGSLTDFGNQPRAVITPTSQLSKTGTTPSAQGQLAGVKRNLDRASKATSQQVSRAAALDAYDGESDGSGVTTSSGDTSEGSGGGGGDDEDTDADDDDDDDTSVDCTSVLGKSVEDCPCIINDPRTECNNECDDPALDTPISECSCVDGDLREACGAKKPKWTSRLGGIVAYLSIALGIVLALKFVKFIKFAAPWVKTALKIAALAAIAMAAYKADQMANAFADVEGALWVARGVYAACAGLMWALLGTWGAILGGLGAAVMIASTFFK